MRIFLLSLAILTTSCGPMPPTGTACTTEARASLTVTVLHATTHAAICDATVVASEGSFSETLMALQGSPCTYSGPYERAGTYTITVSKPGFATATETGVVVSAGECHVNGVTRTIHLSPM